jgi:WD40 repeat protein
LRRLGAAASEGVVASVEFSPDGTTTLTGSWDRTARLWDAANGKPLGPPLRHDDHIANGAVVFSPDGKCRQPVSGVWRRPAS